jgi:micrococcal nuclease
MHTFPNKYIIHIVAIFLGLCLPGCSTAPGSGYHARVVYVYDGDTVRLDNGERVRYLGIDTPEMNYRKPPPERFAEQAKRFNEDLVYGKIVRLEFDAQTRDKYNRLLAYVYVDDVFVNAKIIESGYGKVFIIQPNIKYADDFILLQGRAKQAKKGIWSP